MKRGLFYILSALVVLSMLLGACSTPATEAPQPVDPPAPTEAPEPTQAPEPTEEPEPTAPPMATPEDLDAAYGAMLSSMQAYNTIDAETLMAEMAEDAPPFLLDVRTAEEVEASGHIEGATHIPLAELAQHTDLLSSFDTPIVTYCGTGWRATIAMTALHALGWENVRALKVTFEDWVTAGNPVVEGLPENMALDAAQPEAGMLAAIDEMLAVYGVKPFGVIEADGLNTALAEKLDMVVIDVRTAAEVEEQGSIDTGEVELIHIPLEELVAQRAMWPAADTEVAVYCGSGHRSTMALTILGSYGYDNVTSLKGGFGGWAEAGYPVVGGAPMGADVALDTNYQVMLGAMQAYNTIDAETLMAEMAEDAPPFLLDVRTTEEVEANGHIEGATHIPLAELAQHIDLLPSFDTPIVTYCGSGWRATIAMTALHGMGWTDVRALKVAFEDWVAAGNPVVEGLPENVALNAAQVDAAFVEGMDAMLAIYGAKPYGVIEAEGLNTTLVENPALIVIDVRTPEEVAEKGVIDTGEAEFIFLPLEELVATKDMWPADKSADIAVYCGSGHRSTMALTILGSYGYTKLSSLKGGFAEWAEAGYPVTEYALADTLTSDTAVIDANLQTMLDTMQAYNTVSAEDLMAEMVEDAPPFLLDVRTAEEVEASGHIEGATHIPLNELAQHLDLLPSFDTPIVTYCGTGWRATIAMTSLHALGWQDVRALKTTFEEWVAAGNPVVEGLPENIVLDAASPDPVAVSTVDAALTAYGVKPFGVIEADGLNTALVENANLIVIDARTPAEIEEKGVVDTGAEPPLLIPLEEIIANMDQWPADKAAPIVEYCGSGHRSTMAMTILWLHGYSNVSSLKGGFGAWVEAGYPVTEYVAE